MSMARGFSLEFDVRDFATAYGPKIQVGLDTSKGGPGAKQSFKEECDINRIMAKYQKTGVVNWLSKREGQYRDVSSVDFMESMNVIAKANEMFAELPSSVRKRFANDPAEFLVFMHDEGNTEEAIKLGLATRRPEPAAPPAKPSTAPPVVSGGSGKEGEPVKS